MINFFELFCLTRTTYHPVLIQQKIYLVGSAVQCAYDEEFVESYASIPLYPEKWWYLVSNEFHEKKSLSMFQFDEIFFIYLF